MALLLHEIVPVRYDFDEARYDPDEVLLRAVQLLALEQNPVCEIIDHYLQGHLMYEPELLLLFAQYLHPSPLVRYSIALIAGHVWVLSVNVFSVLFNLTYDSDPDVRIAAFWSMKELQDGRVEECLRQSLHREENHQVRTVIEKAICWANQQED